MRLIEKLMDKAKSRPRWKECCMITPFHCCEAKEDYLGVWTATLQRMKKGKQEILRAGFDTQEEAEAWADENTNSEDAEIIVFCATEDRLSLNG